MKKVLVVIFLSILIFLSISICSVYADTTDDEAIITPETYIDKVIDAMPETASELLPESESSSEIAEKITPTYLITLSAKFFQKSIKSFAKYFLFFTSVIIIGALANGIETSLLRNRNTLTSWITVLVASLEAFVLLFSLVEEVIEFSSLISDYMLTLGGVLSTVALVGGSFNKASLMTATLGTIIAVSAKIVSIYLLPIIRISFATSLASSVSDTVNLKSISSAIKSFFIFALGFISTVTVIILTFQTYITEAEDTLAARGIKFAASSTIPVVGGAVSDSLRTVAASVSLVKGSVGIVGVLGIAIITLYPLTALFSAKLSLWFSEKCAELLGVSAEKNLLSEVGSIINLLIASVSIISVMYIFVVGLFIKGAVSYG